MNLLLPGDHPYPTLLKPGNGIYLDDLEHNKMIAIRVLFAGDLSKCKTFRKALIAAHFFCELIVLFCMMTIPKPVRTPRFSRPAPYLMTAWVICGWKIFSRKLHDKLFWNCQSNYRGKSLNLQAFRY